MTSAQLPHNDLGRRGLATGSLDMVHLAAPVKMGDALVIRCMVSGVGHRSLEVSFS